MASRTSGPPYFSCKSMALSLIHSANSVSSSSPMDEKSPLRLWICHLTSSSASCVPLRKMFASHFLPLRTNTLSLQSKKRIAYGVMASNLFDRLTEVTSWSVVFSTAMTRFTKLDGNNLSKSFALAGHAKTWAMMKAILGKAYFRPQLELP